jgi:hypothetical protein
MTSHVGDQLASAAAPGVGMRLIVDVQCATNLRFDVVEDVGRLDATGLLHQASRQFERDDRTPSTIVSLTGPV